jgi:hypothetical protein
MRAARLAALDWLLPQVAQAMIWICMANLLVEG